MDCISCTAPLDAGVEKLAKSLGASRVICSTCLTTYSTESDWVQMNVRIPRTLDHELRKEANVSGVPYARIVRDRLKENR